MTALSALVKSNKEWMHNVAMLCFALRNKFNMIGKNYSNKQTNVQSLLL